MNSDVVEQHASIEDIEIVSSPSASSSDSSVGR